MDVHLVITVYNGVVDEVAGFLDEGNANKYAKAQKIHNRDIASKLDVLRRDIEVN